MDEQRKMRGTWGTRYSPFCSTVPLCSGHTRFRVLLLPHAPGVSPGVQNVGEDATRCIMISLSSPTALLYHCDEDSPDEHDGTP
jgi:hypothetical protein